MKKLMICGALFLCATSVHALPTISSDEVPIGRSVFEFSQQLDNGRFLTGIMVAGDSNNDGFIDSYGGEVDRLYVDVFFVGDDPAATEEFVYEVSPGFNPFTDFINSSDFTVPVVNYALDAGGTIGDFSFRGPEGLRVENANLLVAIGESANFDAEGGDTCDDTGFCGGLGVFSRSVGASAQDPDQIVEYWELETIPEGPINVTSGPLGDAVGVSEAAALTETGVTDGGGFIFAPDPDTPDDFMFWIDPLIAVGYDYEAFGTVFTAMQAPSLGSVNDLDGYTLLANGGAFALAPGEAFDFVDEFGTGLSSFSITGIDPLLGLDPDDGTAFVTGISLLDAHDPDGNIFVTQTPQTEFVDGPSDPTAVPLPAAGWLLLAGFGGLFGLYRRANRLT